MFSYAIQYVCMYVRMSDFYGANWFFYLVRPVYRDEQVEEEVVEGQSAEVTLDQLEEEIHVRLGLK